MQQLITKIIIAICPEKVKKKTKELDKSAHLLYIIQSNKEVSVKTFVPLLILLFCFSVPIMSVELVINGDFEQPFSTGWTESVSSANYTIDRATHYDPDPNYEAYVYQGTGNGYVSLHQTFLIPSTDIDFSVNAKVYAWDNDPSSAWAGATVLIEYLDVNAATLGETYICARSTNCPWSNGPTSHIIEAADSMWHSYSFNINDELAHLSAVNPADVKKITVSLYTQIYHC